MNAFGVQADSSMTPSQLDVTLSDASDCEFDDKHTVDDSVTLACVSREVSVVQVNSDCRGFFKISFCA